MNPKIGKYFEQELRCGLEQLGWCKKWPDAGQTIVEDGEVTGRRFTSKTPLDFTAIIGGVGLGIEAKAMGYDPTARWTFSSLRYEQREELEAVTYKGRGLACVAFNVRCPKTRGVAFLVPYKDYKGYEELRGGKSCFVSELVVEFYKHYAMWKAAGMWLIQPTWWAIVGKDITVGVPGVKPQLSIAEALPTSVEDKRLAELLWFAP